MVIAAVLISVVALGHHLSYDQSIFVAGKNAPSSVDDIHQNSEIASTTRGSMLDYNNIRSRRLHAAAVPPIKCALYDLELCPPPEVENSKCRGTTLCGGNGELNNCFTLWYNDSFGRMAVHKQSCWHNEEEESACDKHDCAHRSPTSLGEYGAANDDGGGHLFFCCCNTPMCNSIFRLDADINSVISPKEVAERNRSIIMADFAERFAESEKAKKSRTWTVILFVAICAAVVILSIAFIFYATFKRRMRRRRRDHINSSRNSCVNRDAGRKWMNASSPTSGVGRDNYSPRHTANGGGAMMMIDVAEAERDRLLPGDVNEYFSKTAASFGEYSSVKVSELKARSRYSEVYLGELGSGTAVAVKMISLADKNMFYNEVRIHNLLSQHQHANILNFIGATNNYWHNNNKKFLLLCSYHSHGSLLSYLKENMLDIPTACNIITTMVMGLDFLHFNRQLGKPVIAHRDFKSSNVLLKNDLSACISDFGLAEVFDSSKRSEKFAQVGTDRYMAPELLECAVSWTREAFLSIDMYACGMVTWEVLSRTAMSADDYNNIPPYRLPLEAELEKYDADNEAAAAATVFPKNYYGGGKAGGGGSMLQQPYGGDEKLRFKLKLKRAVVDDKKRPQGRPEWNNHEMIAEAWRTALESLEAEPEIRPPSAMWVARLEYIAKCHASAAAGNATPTTMQSIKANATPVAASAAAVAVSQSYNSSYAAATSSYADIVDARQQQQQQQSLQHFHAPVDDLFRTKDCDDAGDSAAAAVEIIPSNSNVTPAPPDSVIRQQQHQQVPPVFDSAQITAADTSDTRRNCPPSHQYYNDAVVIDQQQPLLEQEPPTVPARAPAAR